MTRRPQPAAHWSDQPSSDAGPLFARSRADDPATSHEAAARVGEFDGEHHARIMAALAEGSATIYELAARTGLDHVAIARRMPELEVAHPPRVARTDRTRPSPTGRQCTVWRALEVQP